MTAAIVQSGAAEIAELPELDEAGFDVEADPRLGDILKEDDAPMFCTWQVGC